MNRGIRRFACTCLLSLLLAFFSEAEPLSATPDLDKRLSDFKAQRPAPAARQRAVMDKFAKHFAAKTSATPGRSSLG